MRPLRDLKVVLSLESHPDAGTRAKIAGEAHRRIGGNAAFAPNNLADSQRRNPDVGGDALLAQFERLHKILEEDFAGMDGIEWFRFHGLLS